jgi:SAM-dependent methyltransferase
MKMSFTKRVVRQTGSHCPACQSPNTSYAFSLNYYATMQHWGFTEALFRGELGLNPKDYVFHVRKCEQCKSTFVEQSYDGLAQYVDQHPAVMHNGLAGYFENAQPHVTEEYLQSLNAGNLDAFRSRQRWVVNTIDALVKEVSATTILDLGASFGTVGRLIELSQPNCAVFYCETNPNSANQIYKRYPSAKIITCPIQNVSIDGSFDIIYCSDVIEHIWDVNDFLSGVSEKLSARGKIIFFTPNGLCDEAVAKGPHWWSYIVPHHCQVLTPDGLAQAARRNGLRPTHTGNDGEEFWMLCGKA